MQVLPILNLLHLQVHGSAAQRKPHSTRAIEPEKIVGVKMPRINLKNRCNCFRMEGVPNKNLCMICHDCRKEFCRNELSSSLSQSRETFKIAKTYDESTFCHSSPLSSFLQYKATIMANQINSPKSYRYSIYDIILASSSAKL